MKYTNEPEHFTMQNFRSVSDAYGGLLKNCRFLTFIRPKGKYLLGMKSPIIRDLPYLTEISEMPGRGFMNMDIRYYGPNIKLPFQTTYEDISLTFLCRSESLERQFFDDWMGIINPINTYDFNYRDDYTAQIDVMFFNEFPSDTHTAPTPVYKITMRDAYPILLNPQALTWADDQFQRVVVSFTYSGWTREFLDPQSSPFGKLVQGVENSRTDPRTNYNATFEEF